MNIKTIKVGTLGTNCYILIIKNNCLIIDPGADYNEIAVQIGSYNVLGILVTHHHFDHVGALQQVIDKYNALVYDRKYLEQKNYRIGDFNFDVIYTPGHTEDSVTFLFKDEKVMFTGDFLFKGTIGRTDLPTGDYHKITNSLKLIREYDTNIRIYPGHGADSTLELELKNNPYLL